MILRRNKNDGNYQSQALKLRKALTVYKIIYSLYLNAEAKF